VAIGKTLREFGVKLALQFDASKAKQADAQIGSMVAGMKSLAFQAAAAASSIMGVAAVTSHNARTLDQNSKQLGLSTSALQEWEYAAKIAAGVGREELMGTMSGISAKLFEAQTVTTEAGQAFTRLGVNIGTLTKPGTTADEVLLQLAESFQKLPDGAYKTGLAMAAGGQGLVNLLPLLNKGQAGIRAFIKEGKGLGVILGPEAIASGAEFDRTLSRIWFVMKNLTYTIGNQLIKYLEPLVKQFQAFVIQNKKFLALGMATVFKAMGTWLGIIFKTVTFVAERFKWLVGVMGGVERVANAIAIAMGLMASFKVIGAIGTIVTGVRALSIAMLALNAPMALIGAAVLAVFLVFQDLFSEDSVILEGVKILKDHLNALLPSLEPLLSAFQTAKGFLSGITSGVAAGLGGGSVVKPSSGGGVNNTQNSMTANLVFQMPPNASAKDFSEAASSGVQDGFEGMLRNTRAQYSGGAAY
jgi:hypothetical protein